ncbi:MAG: class I SAM-dependent methyltransferase [Thermoleophilum sp.]|nr:class I SAM-dependent methyltransferase [Thermoleophilum sp.]
MATLAEINARQQKIWSSGDYGKVAWVTSPLADELVEAVDVRPGSRVLDVATGTGHVALAAARRFCEAVGVDYVPELLEVARRRAAAEGLDVALVAGDAEDLPCRDADCDYVLSAIGAMFAPDQERVAAELFRLARPGGTVTMVNWTPSGFIGRLFATIGEHVPPPAELRSPMAWGGEERVEELFADRAASLDFERGSLCQRFLSPEQRVDFFLGWYGPAHKAAESLDEPAREVFHADLVALANGAHSATDGTAAIDCE